MIQEYKIKRRYQLKSIQNGLKILPWVPAPLAVGYFAGYTDSFFDADFVTVVLIWNLIFFLPAIILHLSYYASNRRTKLKVDKENRTLLITDKNGSQQISFDEVKYAEKVIFSDFRHSEWKQNWQPVPWRNYGYLKLTTHDNKVYLFTSLMLDPHHPPIEIKEILFKFIPLLDESIEEALSAEDLEKLQREEIDLYKAKFRHHSIEELEKKTVESGFRLEAKIAAKELLEEKNTLANNV